MIVLLPAATPVTRPVLLTVAAAVLLDTQGLTAAAVAVPDSWLVPPDAHMLKPPVIAGSVFIVTVAVVVQPLLFV